MKKMGVGSRLKIILLAAALAGCSGSSILPRESHVTSAGFHNYEQVLAAYGAVIPATTRMPDLTKLGFDVATARNVEILATPDISERFMVQGPNGSAHVPPAVETCIASHERCTAFVFHCRQLESRHVGNALLDIAGFEQNVVETGWSADVLLVLQDGTVIYKIMSGTPRIETTRESVQPLGLLQDIAKPDEPKKDKSKKN